MAKQVRVCNITTGRLVAQRVRVASSAWSRFWGLMGAKGLLPGEGLLLKPCNSVHTAFMRFPIDVVFIDENWRVVRVVSVLRPFRLAASFRRSRFVLELPAGAATSARLSTGDHLEAASA